MQNTFLPILIHLNLAGEFISSLCYFQFVQRPSNLLKRPAGWSFCVGLLQATFTLTGYGMVAAMCEEVQNADREVPRAMVLSVVASGFLGLLWLIPILFVLPDVSLLLSAGQPIGIIFQTATGSAAGGLGLLILVIGVMIFAAIAALATSSRCVYSFARDGAMPGSGYLKGINKRLNVPLPGLIVSTIIISLLGLIYLGSVTAFDSFTGVTAICLSLSFGSPILVSLFEGRQSVKGSSYSLGRFGYLINIISVSWVFFALVLFCMPVSVPVTASTMNYASVVIAGFAGISVIYYYVRGRTYFSGPPVTMSGYGEPVSEVLEGQECDSGDRLASSAIFSKA